MELVKQLVARGDTVFVGVRDLNSATALKALNSSKLHIVKLVSASEEDAEAVAAEIKKTSGSVDVVIANAGIANFFGTAVDTPVKAMRDHWEVNTLGPLILFKAVLPVLKPDGKFIIVSSIAASIAAGASLPVSAIDRVQWSFD